MDADVSEETDVTLPGETEESAYEVSPEDATGFDKPPVFNRKKVLMALCVSFAAVICGGLLFNAGKNGKNGGTDNFSASVARTPTDMLTSQMNRAVMNQERETRETGGNDAGEFIDLPEIEENLPLPSASWNEYGDPAAQAYSPQARNDPPPAYYPPAQGQAQTAPQIPSHYFSPLTPRFEGSFNRAPEYASQTQAAQTGAYDDYLRLLQGGTQPAQADGSYGNAGDGFFNAANSLWIGTVIPGILITAINTDLPGNIIARVTENIYDSRTGRNLLVPQGTILSAQYSSSVSYAQKRVQIAWDTLIRPDGYQLDLGGMGGVDRAGMSGQEARYSENWFEYLKAAGIIALFTVANSRLAEEAAKTANDAAAGSFSQANAEFVSQMSANIVNRAMNIQPTLLVESGTLVNIMLNRSISLPSMDAYPAEKKYVLE